VDQVHFVPTREGHLFKLPKIVGPFIVNNRQAMKEVEDMIQDVHI